MSHLNKFLLIMGAVIVVAVPLVLWSFSLDAPASTIVLALAVVGGGFVANQVAKPHLEAHKAENK